MQASGSQEFMRINTRSVVVELGRMEHPTPTSAVFEEDLHTISLQQSPRQTHSVGRYQGPWRQSFRDIGRLLFLPASVPLEVYASGGPVELVRCQFAPSVLNEYCPKPDLERQLVSNGLDIRNSRIAAILSRISEEIRQPSLASVAMTEALGATLIIEFARYLCEQPKQGPLHRGGLSRRQFRMITDFIDSKEDCASLTELGELTGLSLRHLTRAFKQTTGETVFSYIEQVRFQRAQRMLGETDLLIKDIAFRLGFASPSSFTVAFRKIGSESPLDYRRRKRGEQGRRHGPLTRRAVSTLSLPVACHADGHMRQCV